MDLKKYICKNKLISIFLFIFICSISACTPGTSSRSIKSPTKTPSKNYTVITSQNNTKPKNTLTPNGPKYDRACVVADAINVRSGPDNSYSTESWMVKGECVEIALYNSNGSWGRMNYTNNWVYMGNMKIAGSGFIYSPPITSTNVPQNLPTAAPNYIYPTSIPSSGGSSSGSGCHPSYSGACLLMNVGDYDCAGGQGDGPNYVFGPIYVNGSDPFGLDRDKDGVACEP